jgi:hypothetical protein
MITRVSRNINNSCHQRMNNKAHIVVIEFTHNPLQLDPIQYQDYFPLRQYGRSKESRKMLNYLLSKGTGPDSILIFDDRCTFPEIE